VNARFKRLVAEKALDFDILKAVNRGIFRGVLATVRD